MKNDLKISDFISAWTGSPFSGADGLAWQVTSRAEEIIRACLGQLGPEYVMDAEVAVHRSAVIEGGCTLKGPIIIGPRSFVAAGAYLRGGVFLDEDCIIGPGSELKTSFMFKGSKIAHLNFVGDSILGSGVNVEAGAVIANYRNEKEDKTIRIKVEGQIIETGVEKFGALVGDGARIGANAVIAPGALIWPGMKVARLQLVDQAPV